MLSLWHFGCSSWLQATGIEHSFHYVVTFGCSSWLQGTGMQHLLFPLPDNIQLNWQVTLVTVVPLVLSERQMDKDYETIWWTMTKRMSEEVKTGSSKAALGRMTLLIWWGDDLGRCLRDIPNGQWVGIGGRWIVVKAWSCKSSRGMLVLAANVL